MVTDNKELLDDEKRMIHGSSSSATLRCARSCSRVDMIRRGYDGEAGPRPHAGNRYSRLPVYHEDYDSIVGSRITKTCISSDGRQGR